jgi:curved DNA-binding protein CbpA
VTSLGRDEAAQRLGVVGDADEEQIERAFRRAVRSAHPDLGGDAHELAS